MKIWNLFPQEERERIQKVVQKHRQGKNVPSKYEVQVLTKQGAIKHCEIAVSSITYEGEYATLIVAYDRKKSNDKETEQL